MHDEKKGAASELKAGALKGTGAAGGASVSAVLYPDHAHGSR